ncbi:MAG TPA: hypothetical protein VIG87_03870 [Candidatus Udaeobacter sp.]
MKKKGCGEAGGCHCGALSAICSVVSVRALQIFLTLAMLLFVSGMGARGELSTGKSYSISFADINGQKLSTADGHITIVVLTTSADREQARSVGDHVPDFCLGNPAYRMITVVHFVREHLAIGRRMATTFIHHRVREEAKRLQARYDAQKIGRDARSDIFVVTDFDGTIASQLSQSPGATDFCVFVFGKSGELLAQWHTVPSSEELAAAVKKSD